MFIAHAAPAMRCSRFHTSLLPRLQIARIAVEMQDLTDKREGLLGQVRPQLSCWAPWAVQLPTSYKQG